MRNTGDREGSSYTWIIKQNTFPSPASAGRGSGRGRWFYLFRLTQPYDKGTQGIGSDEGALVEAAWFLFYAATT